MKEQEKSAGVSFLILFIACIYGWYCYYDLRISSQKTIELQQIYLVKFKETLKYNTKLQSISKN